MPNDVLHFGSTEVSVHEALQDRFARMVPTRPGLDFSVIAYPGLIHQQLLSSSKQDTKNWNRSLPEGSRLLREHHLVGTFQLTTPPQPAGHLAQGFTAW
jgi:hypothetical protein